MLLFWCCALVSLYFSLLSIFVCVTNCIWGSACYRPDPFMQPFLLEINIFAPTPPTPLSSLPLHLIFIPLLCLHLLLISSSLSPPPYCTTISLLILLLPTPSFPLPPPPSHSTGCSRQCIGEASGIEEAGRSGSPLYQCRDRTAAPGDTNSGGTG